MTTINVTAQELIKFRESQKLSQYAFAQVLGVTAGAVKLWEEEKRSISPTNSKVIRLFIKYPQLVKEF